MNYHKDQLNKVAANIAGYAATIKIKNPETETKWLDVNRDSIQDLKDWLNEAEENQKDLNEKLKDLEREVKQWVNQEFNFIQVNVLETMAGGDLFEYIRENYDLDEFLMDYNKEEDYKLWLKENEEEDTEENKEEFCREEEEFQQWLDEQENYPMWNTLFEWKEEPPEEFIQAAIKSGFGVIEGLEDFNTTLFVSGAGYSFYGQHWIPMYLRLPFNQEKAKQFEGVSFKHL